MNLASVKSRANVGVKAVQVDVEVHLSGGLPCLSIVGLPETAVKEAKDRVRSALLNSRFEFPARRITVSLAPADLPKEGGRFDLPIALGILAASKQIKTDHLHDHEFLGELSLAGQLRPVNGVLPALIAAHHTQHSLIVPQGNATEAALINPAATRAASNLLQVVAYLNQKQDLAIPKTPSSEEISPIPDLNEVRGQARAKRALEIAAAGSHNLLFIGPPGTGKTMLAARLPGILPPLQTSEALETATLYSISQHGFSPAQWKQRPWRAPHHSASAVAMVGGGCEIQKITRKSNSRCD